MKKKNIIHIWATDNNGEVGKPQIKKENKKKETYKTIGKYTKRKHNEKGNGKKLYDIAKKHNMNITNTNYGCRGEKKCTECAKGKGPNKCKSNITWTSPDGRTERQIDYILINNDRKNCVKSSRTEFNASTTSENQHKAIIMEVKIKNKKEKTGKERHKKHITYDLQEFRNSKDRIKLKEEDYEYEVIKKLAKGRSENTEQEIQRIWTTVRRKNRK